ncbi:hypothetical protein Y032_0003g1542 [Ancylostoma ceylanicum]|uniref:Uncharacterized protein n=1 Tax=Ancylostoma ceylanicum TaxID=53326 RepID=A0A016VY90_9BILA|nr:hypothetical protein Y032_0003g1542 [Ancylostoma ceylanicum]
MLVQIDSYPSIPDPYTLGILAATAIWSPCDLTRKHHKSCRGHSSSFNLQEPSSNARPILTKSHEESLGDYIASQFRPGHTSCWPFRDVP